MNAWQLKVRDDLYQLFFQYCEQQGIDCELHISNTGTGELFSLQEADTIACWRTWSEGYLTLKSMLSEQYEWVGRVPRERFQQEYPDAYEHFLQTASQIALDTATDFSFCYHHGEPYQVVVTGWRQA